VALNSLFGYGGYGEGYYGGSGPGQEERYLSGNALLEALKKKYLSGNTLLEKSIGEYVHGNTYLVYSRSKYLQGLSLLNARRSAFLQGQVQFVYGLYPYEVDEFQVIVDHQKVKFYWKDSINASDKSYILFDSIDNGKNWNLLDTTNEIIYELDSIPFDINKRIYKVMMVVGPSQSYGYISYPSYSFRNFLTVLDSGGYWDIDPSTNIYKLFEGIYKETLCRLELEKDYTKLDYGITRVRNSRLSDIYGEAFGLTTSSPTENYKRQIWNLLIGFRNTTTYHSLYHVTKAFTNIPPRIRKLSEDGWVIGKSILGKDTIPLSELTALYGINFQIHLPKIISGKIATVVDSTATFDTTSNELFNSVDNYYRDDFLTFKTGANAYKSRRIQSYAASNIRITTQAFPEQMQINDEFFISLVQTDLVEDYIKKAKNLHSYALYKYYSDYITENHETGFSGSTYNMQIVPSKRLRIDNSDNTVNDGGKLVQAMYDSGTTLTRVYPLSIFGGQGIVCWDSIIWGDSQTDLKVYMTFASTPFTNDWTYSDEATIRYIQFEGINEYQLNEYIKDGTEQVYGRDMMYIDDVDYEVNYREGLIKRTINSRIPEDEFVTVSYKTEWGEVKQNQTLNFSRDYFKYKIVVDGVEDIDEFEFSGFYIKVLR